MSNKDYVEEEIENLIINNINQRRYPTTIIFGRGKINLKTNHTYDDFLKLNLRIMKYYNSIHVSETFENFFQEFNTIRKQNVLSQKEIEKFNIFVESYEIFKELKSTEEMFKYFHIKKQRMYEKLIKLEEEQRIKEVIKDF